MPLVSYCGSREQLAARVQQPSYSAPPNKNTFYVYRATLNTVITQQG
jgi:hypothetical protein